MELRVVLTCFQINYTKPLMLLATTRVNRFVKFHVALPSRFLELAGWHSLCKKMGWDSQEIHDLH